MDIARLSTELAQDTLMNQVGTAVLSKSMDRARSDAEGLALLMDSAALAPLHADSGKNVDLLA
jgi:hypothetical protein